MSQVVRSFLVATALLVHASPSFSEAAFAPMQLPKILVSTFNPENDPESGGIFAIRMWSGSRSKGLCNQDKRVLIVAVPEHFELDHEPGQAHLLSRMGAYLDETCGKDAKGFQLFASKLVPVHKWIFFQRHRYLRPVRCGLAKRWIAAG